MTVSRTITHPMIRPITARIPSFLVDGWLIAGPLAPEVDILVIVMKVGAGVLSGLVVVSIGTVVSANVGTVVSVQRGVEGESIATGQSEFIVKSLPSILTLAIPLSTQDFNNETKSSELMRSLPTALPLITSPASTVLSQVRVRSLRTDELTSHRDVGQSVSTRVATRERCTTERTEEFFYSNNKNKTKM